MARPMASDGFEVIELSQEGRVVAREIEGERIAAPLPFTQWCDAIGLPALSDDAYASALTAASGVKVPEKPAPPFGGGNANRAERRLWDAQMRIWKRARAKALAALRAKYERDVLAQEGSGT
jgi:hypothetical protein